MDWTRTMTREATRQLALAATSQKLGYAFFVGREVVDWGVARKASDSVENAFAQTVRWIRYYVPTRLFIEQVNEKTRKGRYAVSLIHALGAAGSECGIQVIAVPRRRRHKNKFIAAQELVEKHPHLRPWLPKPRVFWAFEPHRMGIFEAVALVEDWYAMQGTS
jgi:hypothetical protein